MEPSGVSERNLAVQSVRMATAVRVRGLVCTGWRGKSFALGSLSGHGRIGDHISSVRIRDCDDLVFPAPCGLRSEVGWRRDLPNRQDEPRRASHHAFPGARDHYGRVRAARLAGAQILDLL